MDKKQKRTMALGAILATVCIALISFLFTYLDWWIIVIMYLVAGTAFVLLLIGLKRDVEWLYKFMLSGFYIGIFLLIILGSVMWSGIYYLFYNQAGELDKDAIQSAIASKGSASAFFFIALSFLQVTFIPIPSTVTTLIGIALFGNGKGFLYSFIGQVLGMFFAFFLGKKFGAKLIIWIVGKETYQKYHQIIKGRDKIVIFFMLLFPFFPDDIICMFAGLTSYTPIMFLLLLMITRTTTLGYTIGGYELISQIANMGVLKYVIYAILGTIIFIILINVWKKGDLLEQKMLHLIDKIIPSKYRKLFVSDLDKKPSQADKSELPFYEDAIPDNQTQSTINKIKNNDKGPEIKNRK